MRAIRLFMAAAALVAGFAAAPAVAALPQFATASDAPFGGMPYD